MFLLPVKHVRCNTEVSCSFFSTRFTPFLPTHILVHVSLRPFLATIAILSIANLAVCFTPSPSCSQESVKCFSIMFFHNPILRVTAPRTVVWPGVWSLNLISPLEIVS